MDALRADPSAKACISNWRWFGKVETSSGNDSHLPTRARVLLWYLGTRAFASNSSLMIERSTMLEVGGYPEKFESQDYALICDLARRGRLTVNPEVLSFVRVHDEQRTSRYASEQWSYGIDVMMEHLQVISDIDWSRPQVESLFAAIHRP